MVSTARTGVATTLNNGAKSAEKAGLDGTNGQHICFANKNQGKAKQDNNKMQEAARLGGTHPSRATSHNN
jgi:hypothetical protein